jgi:subtilisin family serine protease
LEDNVMLRRSHPGYATMIETLETRRLLSAGHSAVPDVHVQLTPTDARYADGSLWGLKKIGAPAAWDTRTGSSKVVVADIDSGIDYSHPDLYKNIWVNQGEIPPALRGLLLDTDADGLITFRDLNQSANSSFVFDGNGDHRIDARDLLAPFSMNSGVVTGGWDNGVSDDGDTYVDDLIGWNFVNNSNNPYDDNSHGTHTAGTIGATANDGGVVGVNWQVQIMALKFLDAGGSGSFSSAATAIRYSADHGARVSNNSWGGYGGRTGDEVYNAISYAGSKGELVVAAAGNDGFNNDTHPYRSYPASYDLPNVIAVAATDSKDGRPNWSNYGKSTVDLGAPGVGIWSTIPGGGYASYSGTSMATPHVTGAAALLLSKNASLDYSQLKTLILNNVDPVSSLNKKTVTGGRLNLYKALAATAASTAVFSAGGSSSSTTLAITSPSSSQSLFSTVGIGLATPARDSSRGDDSDLF